MRILGIQIGHDSGASLVVDDQIVADAAEERFTRIKHYSGLPINAIDFCLKAGCISISDIDFIGVPSKNSYPELNFLLDLKGGKLEKKSGPGRTLEFARRIMKSSTAKPPLYIKNFPIKDSTEIIHVEHHLAHAASAYYTCGSQENQLIVTMDGAGDGSSICIWRGEGGRIIPLKKFPVSASLGWFYSNVTEALGWWHGDGEGKTMGLAPYGDYAKVNGLLDAYYPKFSNGELVKPHDFGPAYFWNENGAYQWHFDESYEIKKLVIGKYGRENIAAEAQRILEEQATDIIFAWLEKENIKNLCCAGGVFLNVKLNQMIWNSDKVKNHHIFPNAGDAGLPLGAALYVYYKLSNQSKMEKIFNISWGPQFSNAEIEAILEGRGLKYEHCKDISKRCAELLAEGKIIGWFQGRMESGPRALGNRSILMSPEKAENKDIINARVKFREAFRPFCPSIIEESRCEYLNGSREEPFMITSFDANTAKRDKIPAVVHVDGTVRPQTVREEVNPKYYDLIKRFGDITGIPVILNTSFNIRGDPIVCSPRDAIKCFYDTGLDYLAIGDFLLSKGDGKR